jgi:hypothetical protein
VRNVFNPRLKKKRHSSRLRNIPTSQKSLRRSYAVVVTLDVRIYPFEKTSHLAHFFEGYQYEAVSLTDNLEFLSGLHDVAR